MPKTTYNGITPQDAQEAILSPITKALINNNLTLDRLCKDLNDVIITTSDNPNAKLKGVDMGLKLQQAYPAERQELEITGVQLLAPAVKKPKSAGK